MVVKVPEAPPGHVVSRIKPGNHDRVEAAVAAGALEVLWETSPKEILRDRVHLARNGDDLLEIPAEQLFVFIRGELPTAFLRASGVEIETHFGAP